MKLIVAPFLLTLYLLLHNVQARSETPPPDKAGEMPPIKPVDQPSAHGEVNNELVTKAVDSSNRFGFRLYRLLNQMQPNFVFSPLSIAVLMALFLRGSNGDTLKEIFVVLNFGEAKFKSVNELQIAFHTLVDKYHTNGSSFDINGYECSLISSIWVDDKMEINPHFLSDADLYYHTRVRGMNFDLGTERAKYIMNKWVKDNSHGKMLSCGIRTSVFNRFTDIVAINTMFFSAQWAEEFQDNLRTEHYFHSQGKHKVKAYFLQKTEHFNYVNSEVLSAGIVELPFKSKSPVGNNHSLIMVLPNMDVTLSDLENKLGNRFEDVLDLELGKLKRARLNLMFPEFAVQDSLKLDRILPYLGIKHLFFQNSAELPFITTDERVHVSRLMHEANFDFKYRGTGSHPMSHDVQQQPDLHEEIGQNIIPFILDRPFFFILYETKLKALLYMGRVTNV